MGKYAIIVVFALTFGLITYSHGLKNVLLQSETQAARGYGLSQAQNIAQSAAMVAYNRVLDEDGNFEVPENATIRFPDTANTFLEWVEMGGEYSIELTNSGDTLLTLETIGRAEEIEYRVTVLLDKTDPLWNPNLTHAVFAGQSMSLSGSAQIQGDAGTNAVTAGAVSLNGNPQIEGGLAIGPGGIDNEVVSIPWGTPETFIGDGVSNLPQPLEFDLPPFPAFPPQINPGGNISGGGWPSSSTIYPGAFSQYIPEISLQGNHTLTIDTQGEHVVVHVGNLNIQQGHLNIVGGGDVTFQVENNITLGGSSTLNGSSSTGDVWTYYKGSNAVNFGGSTQFISNVYVETADVTLAGSNGVKGHVISGGNNVTLVGASQVQDALPLMVYAPQAAVELTGSGTIVGSVVANSFSASGASKVIFEEDLEDFPEFEMEGSSFTILSWN